MILLFAGFCIGYMACWLITAWMFTIYQEVLVLRAKSKSPKLILGKRYIIVPEEEWEKLSLPKSPDAAR